MQTGKVFVAVFFAGSCSGQTADSQELANLIKAGQHHAPDFRIRDYRPEDFLHLWQIDQSCFEPGISYSQFELRTYIRRRNAFTLVAESAKGGGIVGFLVAETGRNQAHVITIDVVAAARKKGIGSMLLEAGEARMMAAGNVLLRLETAVNNRDAVAFYKWQGFDIIGTYPRYYSNGVDALVLEKKLLRSNSSS